MIGEALYIINKQAKVYRDLQLDLKKYLFEKKVPSIELKKYLLEKIENLKEYALNYEEYTLEDANCQLHTIKTIDKAIKELYIDNYLDFDFDEEEAEEYYKQDLKELEEIKAELLRVNNAFHDTLKELKQNKIYLYQLKNRVIEKINPDVVDYHLIATKVAITEYIEENWLNTYISDYLVAPMVELDGFKFHLKAIEKEKLPENINYEDLQVLDLVSSKNLLETDMTVEEAICILENYLCL